MFDPSRPPRYTVLTAMRLYTPIILALVALSARAASLPSHAVKTADLEKKLTEVVKEVLKEDKPIENNFSEQELLDQANSVTDTGNNLRNVVDKIENIPVQIVTEEVKPAIKNFGIEKGSNDALPEESVSNVKREEIDLKNPGEPQRQEHDSQSPEDINSEQETVLTIKQGINHAQDVIEHNTKEVNEGFKAFLINSEQLSSLQNSITQAQKGFTKQLSNLNEEIVEFFTSADSEPKEKPEKPEQSDEIAEKSLLKGLAKEEAGAEGGTTVSEPSIPSGPFAEFQANVQQYLQQIQATVANLTVSIQQQMSQAQGGGDSTAVASGINNGIQTITGQENNAQSDAAASTETPNLWQNIQNSVQSIFSRPGSGQTQASQTQQNVQADQPAAVTQAPLGPFAQVADAITSNAIYQNVASFIQGPQNKPPAQTTAQQPAQPANTAQEGTNSVPTADKPAETKPEGEQKEKPATAAPVSPIQQIIQRNPIVQGIAGTVQRIQSAITNPEKPRERAHGGYGGSSASTGDNNNGNSNGLASKSEEVKEEIKEIVEEPKKEVEAQPIKEEVQEVQKEIVESTKTKTE